MPGIRHTIEIKMAPFLKLHYKFCSFFPTELYFWNASVPVQYFNTWFCKMLCSNFSLYLYKSTCILDSHFMGFVVRRPFKIVSLWGKINLNVPLGYSMFNNWELPVIDFSLPLFLWCVFHRLQSFLMKSV